MAEHGPSSFSNASMPDREAETRRRAVGRPAWSRWLPLGAVVMGAALGYAFDLHHFLSVEALRRYQTSLAGFVDANAALAALAYLGVYVAAVTLSFPGASVLTIAGGFMFGCVAGTALSLVAATIGATLIFLIARTSLGHLLAERVGPRTQKLREGFQRESFSYLLFLRLVPLFPFWLVNLAAALFGMRLAPYVAATVIGIVPATFVFSYFGEGLGTALDADGPLFPRKLLFALALLGAIALTPALVRVWRRNRQKDRHAPS
jgi:uncharacterized membrane protein YdjX (TVP38/TMEM64 family)